jgi:TatD DNase family protein
MWVDSHCHPYFDSYDADREEMIKKSFDAGVKKMIAIGCDKKTNRQALALSEKYDFMYATMGIHPADAPDDLDEAEMDFIRANKDKIVAVGEIGLDYHHMSLSKEKQAENFRIQIRLAKELDLPIVVHSRDAAVDTLQILVEEAAEKVVFHCYAYDLEFAKKVWERGYYTSFSGVVTYKNAANIQEAAKNAPQDLFMIETDSPFLAPQSIRGQRNDMSYVIEVGKKVAELREESPEKIAQCTTKNAERFFGI